MKKRFASFFFVFAATISTTPAMALTDYYFATGEDLNFLIDSDNAYALEEIEYELRKFILFRKVEDYLFNLSDSFLEDDD